jgi:Tfp pilus assembly protein PilF
MASRRMRFYGSEKHSSVAQAGPAEAALKRAKDLTNGKVSEIHRQLAALYIDQKRHKEAADELELVLKTEPNAGDAEKDQRVNKRIAS